MWHIIVWGLLTAGITTSVGVGIVMLQRKQRRMGRLQPEPADQALQRDAEMDDMRRRLADAEERLDFAERLLTQQRETGSPRQLGD
jgi:hypothetical protein